MVGFQKLIFLSVSIISPEKVPTVQTGQTEALYKRALVVLFPSVKSMGKFASMGREGRQEAGIFLLSTLELEKLFSKSMKKLKPK